MKATENRVDEYTLTKHDIEVLQESEREIERGEVIELEEAFRMLREKYNIPYKK